MATPCPAREFLMCSHISVIANRVPADPVACRWRAGDPPDEHFLKDFSRVELGATDCPGRYALLHPARGRSLMRVHDRAVAVRAKVGRRGAGLRFLQGAQN